MQNFVTVRKNATALYEKSALAELKRALEDDFKLEGSLIIQIEHTHESYLQRKREDALIIGDLDLSSRARMHGAIDRARAILASNRYAYPDHVKPKDWPYCPNGMQEVAHRDWIATLRCKSGPIWICYEPPATIIEGITKDNIEDANEPIENVAESPITKNACASREAFAAKAMGLTLATALSICGKTDPSFYCEAHELLCRLGEHNAMIINATLAKVNRWQLARTRPISILSRLQIAAQ